MRVAGDAKVGPHAIAPHLTVRPARLECVTIGLLDAGHHLRDELRLKAIGGDELARVATGRTVAGAVLKRRRVDADNIAHLPRIVERVENEDRRLDKRQHVGRHDAGGAVKRGNAALVRAGGRVVQRPGVGHLRAILVGVGGKVGGVEKEARVGQSADTASVGHKGGNAIGVQERAETARRTTGNEEIGGGAESVRELELLENALKNASTTEINGPALDEDGRSTVASERAAVAIGHEDASEGVEHWINLGIRGHDSGRSHLGRPGRRRANAGVGAVGAVVRRVAPSSAFKIDDELRGRARRDVKPGEGAVEAESVAVVARGVEEDEAKIGIDRWSGEEWIRLDPC